MAYADTLNALGAALGQDGGAPPPASAAPQQPDAPRPLTIQGGYGDTLSALSSALGDAAPAPRSLSTPIQGAAPALSADMMPAPARGRPATADQTIPDDRGTQAGLDAVEGTGRANYDAGPAENGSALDKIKAAPGAVNNLVRAAANAVPIVGKYADQLDASTSAGLGGDYDASMAQQKAQDAGFAQRNPVAAGAAGFAGATGGTLAMLPDALLGAVGGVGARLAGGAAGGAALNAADAAVRGENVPVAALEGAVGGAAGPVLEGGAKLAAKGADLVGKTLSPIIAGIQLRGAAPGDIDALVNNARTASAAAAKLKGMSSDPATLDIRLGQAPAADASGAAQTTSSAVGGDMGLYQAEKAARTVDNGPFNGGDSARSAAAVNTIQAQAPTGDVFAPGQAIRARLDALDKAGQAAEDAANAKLQTANDGRQAAQDQLAQTQAGQRDTALGQAQGAAQAVGPVADPNALGSDFRAAQTDASGASKDAYGKLYKAIDPDGTLTTVVTPLKQAKQSIADRIDPYTGVQPVGPEAALWSTIDRLPDVVPFSSLQNLDTRATAAMKAVRLNPSDHDPQAISRLTALKGAIKDNIATAGQAQADHEAGLVAAGHMHPDNAMEARFRQDWVGGDDPAGATSDGQRSAAVAGVRPVEARAGDASADSATRDAGRQGGRGSVAPPSDPAVPPQARPGPGVAPADLESRVFHQSVPAEPGHSVVPIDVDKVDALTGWQPDYRIAPGSGGKLDRASTFISGLDEGQDFRPPSLGVHDQGMGFDDGRNRFAAMRDLGFKTAPVSMDPASEAAARRLGLVNDAPPRPSADPRFAAPPASADGDLFRAPQRPDVPRPQSLSDFVRSKGGVQDTGGDLNAMGLPRLIAKPGQGLSPDAMREAAAEAGYLGADTARAMRETHPNDLMNALESGDRTYSVHDYDAVHAWDQHDQAREAFDQSRGGDPAARTAGPRPKAPVSAYTNDDIYAPGTQPAPEPANGPLNLTPNWDDGAIARKRTADAAYAEHAQTFKNGVVAPSFKTTGFAGQFQTPPAGILAKAFHPGPTGGAHLGAYLKSAGNDPRALDAVEQYALNGLRAKIGPLGTLRDSDVRAWTENNRPAIQALDAQRPGFLNSVRTAADADRTLADMGQAHKAEMQAHQQAAAQQALADKASTKAAVSQARGLVAAAKDTPAAVYGEKVGRSISSDEVENAVGEYLKTGTAGATRMRGLVDSVQPDRAAEPTPALLGLRKAGVDFMARSFVSDSTGQIVPHKLISFVKENGDTLKELYGHEQTSMFGALARATEANIKWRTETAVKDGSDTAKKIISYMKGGTAGKVAEHLSLLTVATEAVVQGFEHGGLQGAALGAAGGAMTYLANGLRSLGVRSADDLTRAALADVNVAKLLIGKAPTDANPERAHALLGAMRRSLVLAPAATMAARQKQRRQ